MHECFYDKTCCQRRGERGGFDQCMKTKQEVGLDLLLKGKFRFSRRDGHGEPGKGKDRKSLE